MSWKLFFTSLVDNTVVGNRSLASCCTLDHFGGVSWDRRGQFCRCLQSSDAMKKPIQLGQGKKLAAIPSCTSFGIRTTINSPSPRSNTSQLYWSSPKRRSFANAKSGSWAVSMAIAFATCDSLLCWLVWCLLTFFCGFLQNKHTCDRSLETNIFEVLPTKRFRGIKNKYYSYLKQHFEAFECEYYSQLGTILFFKMVVFKDITRTGNRFYYEQKDTRLNNPSNTIFMFHTHVKMTSHSGPLC